MMDDSISKHVYSPKAVLHKVEKLLKTPSIENDDLFKEHKQLKELYYAALLAIVIYKWLNRKFLVHSSDAPDIDLVTEDQKFGFRIEIMDLFTYKNDFNHDYKGLSDKVWGTKGLKDYGNCELLLVSRIIGRFDVSKFTEYINIHKWKFHRIWLCVFICGGECIFFEIYPNTNTNNISCISYDPVFDKKYMF